MSESTSIKDGADVVREIATDNNVTINGEPVRVQRVKNGYGADGAYTDMDEKPATAALQASTTGAAGDTPPALAANASGFIGWLRKIVDSLAGLLITAVEGVSQSWAPGYNRSDLGGGRVAVDEGGAVVTRSTVLTDEGTFRCNFANSSLSVAIGTCSVASDVVTGTFPDSLDLKWGAYFKFDADPESAWTQIASTDSLAQFTLVEPYLGASTTGAASRAMMRPVNSAGITVANGTATLALGTSANQVTALVRRVDYAPLIFRTRVAISQRIINQEILVGLREDAVIPRWFARLRFNSTVLTTAILETGRNPTGAPSVNETQSQTITLPNGVLSTSQLDIRAEMLTERVVFYINDVPFTPHVNVIPQQDDTFACVIEGINGATPPATNTNIVVDYVTAKNHDKVETGLFSDTEKIIAAAAPDVAYSYSVAGVIAINTDLLIIDMSQAKAASVQIAAIGTTGTIGFFATNDLTLTGTACAGIPVGGGAIVTTTNAAGMWDVPKQGRYLRVRLTVATTAGTTTIAAISTQYMPPTLATINQGGTWTVQPGNTANTTPWLTTSVPNAGQGASSTHRQALVANITTGAPTSVKASAGNINSLRVANNCGVGAWFHLYNKASAPTFGTDTPVDSLWVAAGSTLIPDTGAYGDRFSNGIAYGVSDNAAVVPTAGSTITIASTAAAIVVSMKYT